MRRTQKYQAGLIPARTLWSGREFARVTHDNDSLYEALEAAGWWWDASAGSWSNERRSTSIFEGDDGLPSGVFRLRVMANPSEIDELLERIQRGLQIEGCRVFEVSDRYPNRRGAGVRVYVSAMRVGSQADRSGLEPMIGGGG